MSKFYDREHSLAKAFPPPKWMQVKFYWMRDPVVCSCHELTYDQCPDYSGPDPTVMCMVVAKGDDDAQ